MVFDNDIADVWVCVDPGLSGTGYAVFNRLDFAPTHYGVLVARGGKLEWVDRCRYLCEQFTAVLQDHEAQAVVLEFQELFHSTTGMTSANKGDLFKLSVVTGALANTAWTVTGNTPILKKPAEWKGQLPKAIVERRVKAHYQKQGIPWEPVPNHAMDAVGMGFSMRGLL